MFFCISCSSAHRDSTTCTKIPIEKNFQHEAKQKLVVLTRTLQSRFTLWMSARTLQYLFYW